MRVPILPEMAPKAGETVQEFVLRMRDHMPGVEASRIWHEHDFVRKVEEMRHKLRMCEQVPSSLVSEIFELLLTRPR